VASSAEAAQAFRALAAQNGAYELELAKALNNVGVGLSRLAWPAEAVPVTAEAVEIFRRLAAADPNTYGQDFRRALWCFVFVRMDAGVELPQALAATESAVADYEELASRLPAYVDDLDGALATLEKLLDRLGRGQDADRVRRRLATLRVAQPRGAG
jgi:tetratricopeptide (TPR) repeat protein